LPLARNSHGPRNRVRQRGVRISKHELLIIANQFIAPFVVPSANRCPRSAKCDHAARPHNQQRIRLSRFIAGGLLPMFANCPERTIERISRSQRSVKIIGCQSQALRLNDDAKFRAFNVNRPPSSPRATVIRDQGIRFFAIGRHLLCFLKFLFLLGNLGL
jgi:hypothetical protein